MKRPMTPQPAMRACSRWFMIGLLSLGLAVGVAELWCRFFWIQPLSMGGGSADPHFHHRLKPSRTYRFVTPEYNVEVRTNRSGLRGPDPMLPKPAGVTRVFMLGDSFTFGLGVRDQETFCALIEQGLRAQGEAVEVINGGVSAYSPILEYLSLRDQFLAFEPDLVVLWFDLADLWDDAWFQRNLLYDQAGRILRCDPGSLDGHRDWWEWLKTHSTLAKYLEAKFPGEVIMLRLGGFRGYVSAKLRGESPKALIARFKGTPKFEAVLGVDKFILLRESSTAALVKPHWDLSMRYVLMIRELLAERHIPFLLGIYPYGMLVGPDQWAVGRRFWRFKQGKTYDASLALGLFERFSATERIPLLNTFESFRAAANAEKLFYDRDGHFTPAGHRVLATHVLHDLQFLTALRGVATPGGDMEQP